MRIAVFQSLANEVLSFVLDVEGEIPESKFDLVSYFLKKEYPFFSSYKILKAYLDYDKKIIVQLFDELTKRYVVAKL